MSRQRYSPVEIRDIIANIIITEYGKRKIVFNTESGNPIAYGYERLHTSPFGVHVEFTLKQLYMPDLYFSTQGDPLFYIWHITYQPAIKILQPRGTIEGTGFIPDNFYIEPKDLFTHGMQVMKQKTALV